MIDESNKNQKEALNKKIIDVFGDLATNKTRFPSSGLDKKGVPGYVAEWVIDTRFPGVEPLIEDQIKTLLDWTGKLIPGPKDVEYIKHQLAKGDVIKFLTLLEVKTIIGKKGTITGDYGFLKLLQIDMIFLPSGLVDQYPDLVREGMWGIVELRLMDDEFIMVNFKPMQATINLELFKKARAQFSLDEWIDLLITSMGYDSDFFNGEQKLILLGRLLPIVQKSMHLIELAPKGTGKSYFFENISPHIRLVSGGTISPAVLFVNNASNEWGLLARYRALILDEIQTAQFKNEGEIIGTLKGFLANSKLTRGGKHETSSDCSLVMLANIDLDDSQQPVNSFYFSELPKFLQEAAFLDRLQGILPGWESKKLSPDSYAKSIGLKTDFFGDTLIKFRDDLEIDAYCKSRIKLNDKAYIRNQNSINNIASGMMKLLFPNGNVNDEDFKHYCVDVGVHYRQLVWSQLYMMDAENQQYNEKIEYELK